MARGKKAHPRHAAQFPGFPAPSCSDTDKARYKAIEEELSSLSSRYEDNVLDATNAYALFIDDEHKLAGIPADVLIAARQAALDDGKSGWKLTLRMPCYLPVMQYADDRELRATMHRAYVSRASEFGNPDWDNTALIARILDLRRESALLLGYPSFADVSLVPKMAQTPSEVLAFLRELAAKARPFAQRDMGELSTFAKLSELGLPTLMPWDLAFASEKLRQARYGAFRSGSSNNTFPEDRAF